MEHIVITVNGKRITCPSGTSILTAATVNGIDIPTLCHHPELKPYGACRICLVEDEKSGRLMASCVTPAAQDMAILTDSPRVLAHRRNIVRLMMAEHPESCIVCNKGNRCRLRKIAAQLGVGEPDLYPMPNYKPYEQLNPFIIRDLSKCILCGKCIRADHELVVTGAIDYNNRGFRSRPATVHETPLEESNCTFCGTCVSICPTGALSTKNAHYAGTPEQEADSVCSFCGAGCSLSFGVAGGQVVEVNPSPYPGTVNGATLCVRGHFANDYLKSPDRLTRPMLRTQNQDGNDAHAAVSWDEALETIAAKLSEIKREHGPRSLAFIGSSKCSNEENYLFQKIARVIFGSSNVINGGYALGQRLVSLIDEKSHGACRVAPLSGLEQAEVIMVINADPDHTVPVAGYHIKRAAVNGSSIIIIDPFTTELTPFARQWIRPLPAGQAYAAWPDLLNLISAGLVKADVVDHGFIDRFTGGFDRFSQALDGLDPDRVSDQCGLPPGFAAKTVNLIRGKKIAFVMGTDTLHLPEGTQIIDAVFNLALLTGSINGKGAGFFIPARENNLMGSLDMGAVPDRLPGRRQLGFDDERKLMEKAWQVNISPDPGLDMVRFIEAAESGQVRAAYIMGENVLRSLPQPERVKAALEKLEFLVVQDIVNTRTIKLAHVVLPGAAASEKSGSFTNMEGRIQTFSAVTQPPGEALADWEILVRLSKKMGYPEQYDTVERVKQEIRRLVPMYEDLGNHRRGWIKNSQSGNPFAGNGTKFVFSDVSEKAGISEDEAYPFLARIAPVRFHLGSGTRTSRSERIRACGQGGEVEISPVDFQSLGLVDNGRVKLESRFGSIERAVAVNPGLLSGQVFVPMAVNDNDAMNLVNLEAPDRRGTFGWTACRVRIENV